MRAVTIRDKELTVEDQPDPEPGAGEILVRVRAAGVNGADMMQRRGTYPAPPGAPQDIPGLELAAGGVGRGPGAERFSEGDRVMAIVGGGGQAELAVVHERQLMAVPDALDWPAAGGLGAGLTTRGGAGSAGSSPPAGAALFAQPPRRGGGRLLARGPAGGGARAGAHRGPTPG